MSATTMNGFFNSARAAEKLKDGGMAKSHAVAVAEQMDRMRQLSACFPEPARRARKPC